MKFLVIGCGRVGSVLAHTLSVRGHKVTIIDRDQRAISALGTRFPGRTLVGTGFDHDVLIQAEIDRCGGLGGPRFALTITVCPYRDHPWWSVAVASS